MRILVTGGGGFLGGAIVDRLVVRGFEVRALNRTRYARLDDLGVEQFLGDLANGSAVRDAVAGCDVVFHTAAKAGVWGSLESYQSANVTGTRNILTACMECGVGKVIYTSTPSVVFAGRDENGVDEQAPYPDRFLCHYARTKAEAERLVLAANGPDLATIALRPHLIWGPGDNHLVPRILERARAGRLRLAGSGANIVDAVYIDNAADAHLCAFDHLRPGAPCAGRPYFITNDEPMPMRDIVNGILNAAGLPPVRKSIPPALAYGFGAVLETVYKLFGMDGEPIMTRFVAMQLSTAHWFNMDAARRDLGYSPGVSMAEGFARLAQSFV